jgi:hypothetical protein
MKITGSLIFVLFFTAQLFFGLTMIAKLKFEEAEEAFENNNVELTVTKLKEVEAILKSTNPKILYLQILSQSKLIEKDPLKDWLLLKNTRILADNYLKDYESLPDNEDKYREIYKTSELLKNYPATVQAFSDQKSKIEVAGQVKEANELDKQKKADEDFMSFVFFKGYKSGLTLEEAKIEYHDFFKKALKRKNGVNAEIYINKEDMTLNLFVKNGKLAGNSGKLIEPIFDDGDFTIGSKKISDIVNDLTSRFNLNPTTTVHKYDQNNFKYNTSTFNWAKNGKTIIITYLQSGRPNEFWSTATYTQFDKCYFE